jgi:hypothetical protein
VDKFTDPDSDMMVFVISMSVNVFGLNLHQQCHKGIVAQFTWNLSTIIHAKGRIIRVGQAHEVEWRILRVNGSYYDIQEDKMCRKFAELLRNEACMPSYIQSPSLQRIVAYEQIRVLMSQPFNRYTWCAPGVDRPRTVQEYNSERHRRLGLFYSTIAQILLSLPEDMQDEDVMTQLGYFMTDLANKFEEEYDAAANIVDLTWVQERLAVLVDTYNEECAKCAASEQIKGTNSHKTSRKFQSLGIMEDADSERDDEDVAKADLHTKDSKQVKSELKQERSLLTLLDSLTDLKKLANVQKEPTLYDNDDDEVRQT